MPPRKPAIKEPDPESPEEITYDIFRDDLLSQIDEAQEGIRQARKQIKALRILDSIRFIVTVSNDSRYRIRLSNDMSIGIEPKEAERALIERLVNILNYQLHGTGRRDRQGVVAQIRIDMIQELCSQENSLRDHRDELLLRLADLEKPGRSLVDRRIRPAVRKEEEESA